MDNISAVEASIFDAEAYLASAPLSTSAPTTTMITNPPPSVSVPFDDSLDLEGERDDNSLEEKSMRDSLEAIRISNNLPPPLRSENDDDIDENDIEDDSIEITPPLPPAQQRNEEQIFYASDVNRTVAPAVAWTLDLDPNLTKGKATKPVLSSSSRPSPRHQVNKPTTITTMKKEQTMATKKSTAKVVNNVGKTLTRSAIEGIEASRKEETFVPVVNANARVTSIPSEGGVHSRLSAAAVALGERQRQRESERIREEARRGEFSFKPKITKKADKRKGDIEATRERLYRDGEERNVIRECTRYHLKEQQMSEYTFKPETNTGKKIVSKPGHNKPIYERVGDIERERMEKLEGVKKKVWGGEGCTFRPRINSENVNKSKSSSGDNDYGNNNNSFNTDDGSSISTIVRPAPGPRLHSESARNKERMVLRAEKVEEEMRAVNTFRPKLCAKSEQIGRGMAKEKGDFIERQRKWETVQEKKKLEMEFERNKTMRNYFKPEIGNSKKIVREKRKGQIVESKAELVERLSVKDKEAIEENRELKQEELDRMFNFQPEINNVSRALATERRSVEELCENPRGKLVREKARKKEEERRREECSFKPTVMPPPPPVENSTKNDKVEKTSEKIDLKDVENLTLQVSRYNAAREERRQASIRERERDELKDCTFKPNLATKRGERENCGKHANQKSEVQQGGGNNDSYVRISHERKKKNKAVVVRGLGRYLELKQLAHQKERDQKERERRAYGVTRASAADKYPDGTTQVRAFRLSEGGGEELKRRLKEEREESLRRQCTFRPETVERRNREVIRALLEEDEEEAGDLEY